jgi:16S rRNA processing protein RimM
MRLVVARVGRAHGIRGEVTIEVRTDVPEERFVVGAELHPVRPDGAGAPGLPSSLRLTGVREHKGSLLLGFASVHDRTGAEALRGLLLEADVPDRPAEPDAWYDHELVGLAVHDPAGNQVGEITGVRHLPAQDLLVVRLTGGGPTRLVPFVGALVPEVDPVGGRVVVDDPGGLLGDLPERTAETGAAGPARHSGQARQSGSGTAGPP